MSFFFDILERPFLLLSILSLVVAIVFHLYMGRRFVQEETEGEASEDEDDLSAFCPEFCPEEEEEPLITEETRRAVQELFRQWELPAVAFTLVPAATPVAVGGTKIGGCPDLPPNVEWPRVAAPKAWRKHPLAFLAQVNLAEVAPMNVRRELPEKGVLLFFYDMKCMGYGSCRVLYVEDASTLSRGSFPRALGLEYRFAERGVSLAPADIPPCWTNLTKEQQKQIEQIYEQTTPTERLEHDREVKQDFLMPASLYISLRAEHLGYKDACFAPVTYLLGSPELIQDLDEDECVETAHRDYGISSENEEWVLLFQLASTQDEVLGDILFEDVGNLYFWIRRRDLAVSDFSKVVPILQSY